MPPLTAFAKTVMASTRFSAYIFSMDSDQTGTGRKHLSWPAGRLAGFFLLFAGLLLAISGKALSQEDESAPQAGLALVLTIDGAIGPAGADYIVTGIEEAKTRGAKAVIIQMDTPGGLDTSMRDIIRAILASPVPVLTYVSPSGARAASAGTYILYASHIAAMAPGTNLGAATPVSIGGGGLPLPGGGQPDKEPGKDPQDTPKEEDGAAAGDPMKAKMVNDAVAYIRSLAEMRGRNGEWAEKAVREAASLSADAAFSKNVIDIKARSLTDLLDQAHGRTVRLGEREAVLDTQNLTPEPLDPDWRHEFLATITSPNVALILMMIGIYGIIFEFMNPGAIYPGTIGAICLFLALYAFAALPINIVGIGLILLGIALIGAEAVSPSFGALGIGGTIAVVLGATILFDTDAPGFTVSWHVLAGIAVTTLGFTYLAAHLAVTSFRRKAVTGAEEMIGASATVTDWDGDSGHVHTHGERWRARGPATLKTGDPVTIEALDGLTLEVAPAPSENGSGQTR